MHVAPSMDSLPSRANNSVVFPLRRKRALDVSKARFGTGSYNQSDLHRMCNCVGHGS